MSKQPIQNHKMWFPTERAKLFLNKALKLPVSGKEQDWEIELSNPDRIKDFLEFYHHYFEEFSEDIKQALMALILSSFEDSKWEGTFDKYLWGKNEIIIDLEFNLFKDILEMWRNKNSNEDGFAISSLVENILFRNCPPEHSNE